MARRIWITLGILLPLCLICSELRAVDTVFRKSDNRNVIGKVIEITRDAITVESRGKPVSVPAHDIQSVKWTGEPPAFQIARGDETSGNLKKALEGYQQALDAAQAPSAGLKTDLEFGLARTAAKIALNDISVADAAIQHLVDFRKTNSNSYHYYESWELTAQLDVARSNWSEAEAAYEELASATIEEYQRMARIGKARLILQRDESQAESALSEFEAILSLPAGSPGEKRLHQDALIGKSDALLALKRYDDVVVLLEEVIENAAEDDERLQAQAYLRQGRSYVKAGKLKLAALAYLHVDLLFPRQRQEHAEALYHLTSLWKQLGHQQRAERAQSRLQSQYPNNRWTGQ